MADTAAEIVDKMLVPWWTCDKAPVVSRRRRPQEREAAPDTRIGEEFVALVYVNFLITVLLRMRTLVVTAIGMYVFIVLVDERISVRAASRVADVAVRCLALMGVAVGFVYAQMHRDPILSRLTSTDVGRVGMGLLVEAGVGRRDSCLSVCWRFNFPRSAAFCFLGWPPRYRRLNSFVRTRFIARDSHSVPAS